MYSSPFSTMLTSAIKFDAHLLEYVGMAQSSSSVYVILCFSLFSCSVISLQCIDQCFIFRDEFKECSTELLNNGEAKSLEFCILAAPDHSCMQTTFNMIYIYTFAKAYHKLSIYFR